MRSQGDQLLWLFILAIPVACIAWTVTHEEIFREPREFCVKCSKEARTLFQRKIAYIFTCEYCFSFYVTTLVVFITNFRLLIDDWRGYLIAGFSLVWVANIYMSLFGLLRTSIKIEKIEATIDENALNAQKKQVEGK